MKQILITTIFTFVSAFSFAKADTSDIERVSGELAVLRNQLNGTIQDKDKRTITFLISTVAAGVLGLTTAKLNSRGSKDIGDGILNGLGTASAGMGTFTAISVAGYNGFKVVMDIRAIPELQKSIDLKIAELEAAKAVLSNVE
jgi:hypothetical protein